MKIGIDGMPLTIPFPCGSKHYAEQLIQALSKIDKRNEYIIFSKKDIKLPRQKNFRLVKIPTFIPILKRQFFLTYFAKKEKVDIFHFLEPFGSVFLNNLNVVTTVLDLNLDIIQPKTYNPQLLFHRKYMEISRYFTIKNSKYLIAISEFTKKQLVSFTINMNLNTPIKVIHLSCSNKFKLTPNNNPGKQNYFLCLGDYSPRKNIPRVIKAFALLGEKLHKYKLKIIISTSIPEKQFSELISKYNLYNCVDIIKSPTLSHMVKLYNQSICLLFPSLYEGFGLPILEAMACGCPVITSNRGATKETAGDAAYLINPESTKEISFAMERIITDNKISKKLRLKGLKRAKQFSWEKTARETLKVYESVYDSK